MEIEARYFDGKTTSEHRVRLIFCAGGTIENAYILVEGDEIQKRYSLRETDFSSRLGDTPRTINFPDNSKCHVANNDAIDSALERYAKNQHFQFIHKLESQVKYVVPAVLITAIFVWFLVVDGIPQAAESLAYALPEEVSQKLGTGTLDILDKTLFKQSELDEATRTRITNRFNQMLATLEENYDYRLVFRKGGEIKANAFALPSGIIVLTDEMVAISDNDNQLVAVLSHEIGHLVYRHSLRMVMQNSAVAMLVAVITGDPFSTSSIAIALPTIIVNAQFSQAFETEADNFTYEYLTRNKIPLHHFASILKQASKEEKEGEKSALSSYLSSHPTLNSRILRFEPVE